MESSPIQLATIIKTLRDCKLEREDDRGGVYTNLLIACCNSRDYLDGYQLIIVYPFLSNQ